FGALRSPDGTFLENLTVTLVTPGPSSRGITATGTISQTVGSGFDPTPVFYSAAYTQNGGPGAQINASFNNSTSPPNPVPGPIVGAGRPGLILPPVAFSAWRAADVSSSSEPPSCQ